MSESPTSIRRYIGLDIHKHYLVAIGVDADKNQVYGPVKVPNSELHRWIVKELCPEDAVVLEMTTNTWAMVDLLEPYVGSVTVVHPPYVHLITRAQVMTDRKAALVLAQLHAAGLLPPVWVPPKEVRDLRALVAQRRKMVSLATQAKNRLQSLLHRKNILPLPKKKLYRPESREWWETLDLSALEHFRVQSDLDTLAFAEHQVERLTTCLQYQAANDERMPLLHQLPGIGLINGMTILAAVGDIQRFPTAKHLVGYAGLGARVHDSGESRRTGRITKRGRRDLRHAMVEAAHKAARTHIHWRAEYLKMVKRMSTQKAKVAIARKLLVAVWHVLNGEEADRFACPEALASSFFALAYKVGVRNLPGSVSARQFTRDQLDRLGVGEELTHFYHGKKRYTLPPSRSVSSN
jgi:transposase